MTDRAIGIDVGGTKMLGVVVDLASPTVPIERVRVPTPIGEDAIVDALGGVVRELDPDGVVGIGVGVAGLVGHDGVVHTSPNLPGVEGFELKRLLADRLGVTVAVDNDATLAALAEVRARPDARSNDTVFVALGTGVGGAIVVDGRPQRGRHGFAGEFGHMIVEQGGVRCVCGRAGCWERYASGAALERMARDRRNSGSWSEASGPVRAEDVIDAARLGDPIARELIDDFAGWVGLGVANLIAAFDPGRVILGGGVLDAADVVLDPIRAAVARSAFGIDHRPDVEVVVAALGSAAGALGAAMLVGDLGAGSARA